MKIIRKGFPGGYLFHNFQGEAKPVVAEAGIPDKVVIPLKQGFGKEVPSTIKQGDRVNAGQIIGIEDETISIPVHSSVSGIVEEIRKIDFFGEKVNAAVIKSGGSADVQKLENGSPGKAEMSAEEIEKKIYLSGAASLGESGIPTRHNSSIIKPDEVEHVIIHGISSGLYDASCTRIFGEKELQKFVTGLKSMKIVMHRAAFHVVLNRRQKTLTEELTRRLKDYDWVSLHSLSPVYPQERDEVIVPTILKKNFPYSCLSANIGVIVLNVQAVLHVYDAVIEGKPLVEKTIALSGPAFSENLFLKVRVGTSIRDIIEKRVKSLDSCRFVLNSALTGRTVTDLSLPVDRSISGIIALHEKKRGDFLSFAKPGFTRDSYTRTFASYFLPFKKSADTNMHGEERPCISCGYCEDVCPAGIVPHLIYKYVERKKIEDALLNLRIFNCIDCNLCTYVCPSKIDIARFIKEGKNKLKEEYDLSFLTPPDFKLIGLEELKGLSR